MPGSETPRAHVVYVWDNFVRRSPARNVLIVAHSAGGAGTLHLFRERTGEAVGRCRGVAFTDAVHWFLDGDSAVMRVRDPVGWTCVGVQRSVRTQVVLSRR